MDCLEYMRTLPDKAFQLAIADPPYGLDPSASETAKYREGIDKRIEDCLRMNGKIP